MSFLRVTHLMNFKTSIFRFSHAAEAFESCSSKFKAVFAEPKSSSRSTQGTFPDRSDNREARSSRHDDYSSYNFGRNESHGSFVMPIVASVTPSSSEAQLNIICSSSVNSAAPVILWSYANYLSF